MCADRWKIAGLKPLLARVANIGYAVGIAGENLSRVGLIGDKICKRNLLRLRLLPSFWPVATQRLNPWALGPRLVQAVLWRLAVIQSPVQLLVAALRCFVKKPTAAINQIAQLRGSKSFKGMLPARSVPFCLSNA